MWSWQVRVWGCEPSHLSLLSPDPPALYWGTSASVDWTESSLISSITCLTYNDKIIDLCYGNIPGTFTFWPLPGLSKSDHNMVHLIPAYRQKLKRSKLLTRSVKTLSKEDSESLNGCFLCTNWSVFLTGTSSLYKAADVVSSYINFCVDNVINCKMVKSYHNIKLWVMPQLKDLLKGQLAFRKGDKKAAQHEIDKKIREGKQHFKTKLENSFIGNNATLYYWMGIQPITGYKQQKRPVQTTDETKLHHKNTFCTRYDKRNFHMEQEWVTEENQSHSSHPVEVSEEDVRVCFRKISVID